MTWDLFVRSRTRDHFVRDHNVQDHIVRIPKNSAANWVPMGYFYLLSSSTSMCEKPGLFLLMHTSMLCKQMSPACCTPWTTCSATWPTGLWWGGDCFDASLFGIGWLSNLLIKFFRFPKQLRKPKCFLNRFQSGNRRGISVRLDTTLTSLQYLRWLPRINWESIYLWKVGKMWQLSALLSVESFIFSSAAKVFKTFSRLYFICRRVYSAKGSIIAFLFPHFLPFEKLAGDVILSL